MTQPTTPIRHHAIDAVRVGALLLLIVYHSVFYFQPWAGEFWGLQNDRSLPSTWVAMEAFNIWRIPILFLVSGMGVRLAMERRNPRALLEERARRILLPWVFGVFTLGPLSVGLLQQVGTGVFAYRPNQWHLWFLANIFAYTTCFLPLLVWLRRSPDGAATRGMRWLLKSGWFLVAFTLPGVIEALVVSPTEGYASFHFSVHGWAAGAHCFLLGFLCACTIDDFKAATTRHRWLTMAGALVLYVARVGELGGPPPLPLVAVESMLWMLAVFGHAFRHIRQGSRCLTAASAAVLPVYILHEPINIALVRMVATRPGNPWAKLAIVLAVTLLISAAIDHWFLRKSPWLRALFGRRSEGSRP